MEGEEWSLSFPCPSTYNSHEFSPVPADKIATKTHNRYIVNPTAVPINAALNAVDTIDPARPFLLFAGGSSKFVEKSVSTANRKRE